MLLPGQVAELRRALADSEERRRVEQSYLKAENADLKEQLEVLGYPDDPARTAAKLRGLTVSRTEGAWETGGEPSCLIQYHGNGEARRTLAAFAKQHDQAGVLMVKPGQGEKPNVHLSFDRTLSLALRLNTVRRPGG